MLVYFVLELLDVRLLSGDDLDQGEHQRALLFAGKFDAGDRTRAALICSYATESAKSSSRVNGNSEGFLSRYWRLSTRELLSLEDVPEDEVSVAKLSPNGKVNAIGTKSGDVHLRRIPYPPCGQYFTGLV